MSIEHKFDNIETATRELNRLGFSLDDSLSPGNLYLVVPSEIPDDYPMMRGDGKTPRFVALVDPKGTLIFDKPFDKNPVLIGYQDKIRNEYDLISST